MSKQVKPSMVIKKGKKGTSIEFKNINMKLEEFKECVKSGRKAGNCK
jgi:hypothetical protein